MGAASNRAGWPSGAALSGLYVITDSGLIPDDQLAGRVGDAIAGGARLVQYRDKRDDPALRHHLAERLAEVCRRGGARLIINDDVALARAVGAEGVHVGRDDAGVAAARAELGEDAIIGASCYDSLERARSAVAAGADYVAFGRFFPSQTKPDAPPARLGTLHRARRELAVPVCAIGGITADNAAPLVEAGADMLAVIGGVFAAPSAEEAAAAFRPLFDSRESRSLT